MIHFDDIRTDENEQEYCKRIELNHDQLAKICKILIKHISELPKDISNSDLFKENALYNLFEVDPNCKLTIKISRKIINKNKCRCGKTAVEEGSYGNKYCYECYQKAINEGR